MSRVKRPLRETMPELKETPYVSVDRKELQALIQQNETLKCEIGVFVSVFDGLQTLFSGNVNMFSIIPVVTKLMGDKDKMKQLSAIVPIMEKYKVKPTETNDSKESNHA